MTEADFQRTVLDYARLRGWRYTHFRTSLNQRGKYQTAIQGDRGYPDLTLVRNGRLVFVELKADGKYPTPEQRAWHKDLIEAGQEVHVWKPKDWETVVETLA